METPTHIKKEILPVVFGKWGEKESLTEKGYLFIEGSENTPDALKNYSLYSKESPQTIKDGLVFSSTIPSFEEKWVAYIPPDVTSSPYVGMHLVAYPGPGMVSCCTVELHSQKNSIIWEQIYGFYQYTQEGRAYASRRTLRQPFSAGEIHYSAYYTESELGWAGGELIIEVETLFKRPFQSEGLNLAKAELIYNIDVEEDKFLGGPRGTLRISYGPNPYRDWCISSQRHLEDILGELLIISSKQIDSLSTLSRLFSFRQTEENVCKLLVPYIPTPH